MLLFKSPCLSARTIYFLKVKPICNLPQLNDNVNYFRRYLHRSLDQLVSWQNSEHHTYSDSAIWWPSRCLSSDIRHLCWWDVVENLELYSA